MAEQRVVVEPHFGIERQQLPRPGYDQRIDLDDRRVELAKRLVKRCDKFDRNADLRAFEPQTISDVPGMERLYPAGRIDCHLQDLFRRSCRHLLDLDASLGRADQCDPPGVTVDQEAEIELAGNVAALLDIDSLDLAPRGSGLMRDQVLAQQRAYRSRDLFLRAAELDPAGLAAAAGMDLHLDDPNFTAETSRRLDRLGGGIGHPAARHRDTEFR